MGGRRLSHLCRHPESRKVRTCLLYTSILKESPFPEPAADSGSKPADSSISFENVTFSYDGADVYKRQV